MSLRWNLATRSRNIPLVSQRLDEDQDNLTEVPTRFYLDSRPKQQQSRLLVFLVVLFALATVALAIALAVVVIRFHKDDDNKSSDTDRQTGVTTPAPTPKNDDVCLTEGCVMAAARVRGAMDKTANPCEDFYQFACGQWMREHVIPEDKSSFGTFTKLRDDVLVTLKSVLEAESQNSDIDAVKKARNYYQACLNETNINILNLTYIHQYMENELGGFPVLGRKPGGNWEASGFSLENLLVKIRKGTNSLPLIDNGVGQDDKHPLTHIFIIDQPDLGMPSRDYYLKGRDDKTLMAYQTMVKEIAVELGADVADAEQFAKTFVDLEIDIANITVPKEERRDPEKLYNKMSLADLGKNFSGIDWSVLIKGFMGIVGENIPDNEPVLVYAPPYFEKLAGILGKYTNKDIVNYIVGTRTFSKTFYLPSVFSDIKLKYQKVLSGTATQPPRWQSCADSVKSSMPNVVGRLFVKEAFKQAAKADVLDLVGKLKVAMDGMIGALPWMGSDTKVTAKEKLTSVEPRIGYPDKVYDDTALNEKFKQVTIHRDDPLKSLVSLGVASVKRQLEKLREPYDRSEWGMSPATVNAYYSPDTNQITFPAAILQPPFYSKDQPSYLNYGGIGYVIGHEITHGFDDQGRLYDKDGNLDNWWSDKDGKEFKNKAQCIIDQYSNFTVPGTGGMTLNGINTQGENIADNGGIKESFIAYRKWVSARGREEPRLPGLDYSANQLYFLNAAQVWCGNFRDQAKINRILTDPHSLSMYRVYGPMQNFDEFSKAWDCPRGTFMNPDKKCSVW